jgi:hypothetical protein
MENGSKKVVKDIRSSTGCSILKDAWAKYELDRFTSMVEALNDEFAFSPFEFNTYESSPVLWIQKRG